MNEHERAAARRHLEKILASDVFVNADRLCRFLRFTVEAKLKGEEGQIKEYVLGREVFDRDDRYDPRLDPIVRVEARRLRAKLDEYYKGPGQADPIRIELPKGTYAPVIETGVREARPIWKIAGLGLLLIVALGIVYRVSSPATGGMIAVVPARWLWRDTGYLDKLDESLAETIAGELANRGAVPVIGWPSIVRYRGAGKSAQELASELGIAKVLMVSARDDGGATRVTLFFVNAISGQKLWVSDYSRSGLTALQAQKELASTISDALEAKAATLP